MYSRYNALDACTRKYRRYRYRYFKSIVDRGNADIDIDINNIVWARGRVRVISEAKCCKTNTWKNKVESKQEHSRWEDKLRNPVIL